MSEIKKLLILAQNPVPYHTGLYQQLSKLENMKCLTLYEKSFGATETFVPEFNSLIQWNYPLLKGHKYLILSGRSKKISGFLSRFDLRVITVLIRFKPDYVMIQNYQFASSWLILVISKLLRKKILFRGEGTLSRFKRKSLKRVVKSMLARFFLSQCDIVFYSCEGNKIRLLELLQPSQSFFPLTCAVDNEYFASPDKHKQSYTQLKLIFVGRLNQNKNVIDILWAMKESPSKKNLHLTVCGDGAERKRLERFAETHELNVTFNGFINSDQVEKCLAKSDVLVLSSETDNSPKVVNEAMASGLGIVCTNTCGTAVDFVKYSETGYTFEPHDVVALSRILTHLETHRKCTSKLGREAKSLIANFNYEMNAKQFQYALEMIEHV